MAEDEKIGKKITWRISKDELERLVDFDNQLRSAKGISILTPEARVLFWIAANESSPVAEAMTVSGASYRSFYTVLQRLKDAALVSAAVDASDQRVRRLSIDEENNDEF